MLRWFIRINQAVSKKIGSLFPFTKVDIYKQYEQLVCKEMSSKQVIVDIGGGQNSCISKHRDQFDNILLYAIDVSDTELEKNSGVDKKITADVTKEIPLPTKSVDLLISSSVLEHLNGQSNFFKIAYQVLKDQGLFIHVFPCRYAAFAIINQLLPHSWSCKIVGTIFPKRKKTGVFPAYYDKCYYSAYLKLLEETGYKIKDVKLSYTQQAYFSFFVPLYCLMLIWDALCYILNIKNLCSYLCVVATKQSA